MKVAQNDCLDEVMKLGMLGDKLGHHIKFKKKKNLLYTVEAPFPVQYSLKLVRILAFVISQTNGIHSSGTKKLITERNSRKSLCLLRRHIRIALLLNKKLGHWDNS